MSRMEQPQTILREKHIKYFKRCLSILPSMFSELDPNRMTLVFFSLSGLDLLCALQEVESMRADIVEWIYAQQVLPDEAVPESNMHKCGFRGGGFGGVPFNNEKSPKAYNYDRGHIAMTFSALNSLLILGDDLSRVNKAAVVAGLKHLQKDDGSFCFAAGGEESDMRFVYCACSISYVLNDWSGVDMERTVDFIRRSQSYDGGFGQGPFLESHGGSTFCAIAALKLMGQLETALSKEKFEGLKQWCLQRQKSGFQGRPNKDVDTCYSFWVGASLDLLGYSHHANKECNRSYLLTTEDGVVGGFGKYPDSHPDPMHSYLGLCGLAIGGEDGLRPTNSSLNISQRAAEWLASLHHMQGGL